MKKVLFIVLALYGFRMYAQVDSGNYYYQTAEQLFTEQKYDNDYSLIKRNLRKSLQFDTLNKYVYWRLAVCYTYTSGYKKRDSAFRYINKAIEIDSLFDKAYSTKAKMYAIKCDYENAIIEINRAIRILPYYYYYGSRARYSEELGLYYLALNDVNIAIKLLKSEKIDEQSKKMQLTLYQNQRKRLILKIKKENHK